MKKTPERTDIFILGGGIAGISAAVTASREGANVHLADSNLELGGNIGENFQFPLDFTASSNDPFFRESGIWEEILHELNKENLEGTYAGQSRALLSFVKREPKISLFLGQCCVESTLNSSKDRLHSCTLIQAQSNKISLHRADYFIDSSHYGDLSKMVSDSVTSGIEISSQSAKASLPYFKSAVLIEIRKSPRPTFFKCPEWVKIKWENNLAKAKIAWMESLQKQLCGYHHIEWINQDSHTPSSNEICWAAWDFIKNRSPLQETAANLFIQRIIPIPLSQHHFQGEGEYSLSKEDILESRSFTDSVAVGRAPLMEDHSLQFSDHDQIILPNNFEIPLRSLFSRKIKNLFWAGPHASIESSLSKSFSHPPTLAQIGTAVGYCSSKCIRKKRLPRTIAKEGHIEKIRYGLQRKNHRVGNNPMPDDHDLISAADIIGSTTWQTKDLLKLPRLLGQSTNSCLLQFPLLSNYLETINLFIICTAGQKLDIRLFEGSRQNNHIPGACLEVRNVITKSSGEQSISINFETKIINRNWHFLEVRSIDPFQIVEVRNAPVGFNIQYPRKFLGLPSQNPFSEFSIKPDVVPRPHSCALMEILPETSPYQATEISSIPTRPSNRPNLWISQPTDFSYPEFLEINWKELITLSRIDLFFDPSFGYQNFVKPRPTKEKIPTSLIKHYRIYAYCKTGKSKLIKEVKNNHLSHRSHTFEILETKAVEIEILSTHGLDRAQIFKVSAYE